MSETIRVDTSEWERFARTLDGAKPKLIKRLKAAMTSALDLILYWIVSAMGLPSGKNMTHGKNTGLLQGSFARSDIKGAGINLSGEVVTPLLYGLPVETGRASGRPPPTDVIELWVHQKLGLSGRDASQAAFLIARAIGRRGTKGVHMVEQAYQRAVSGKEIDQIFEAELERFVKELAK